MGRPPVIPPEKKSRIVLSILAGEVSIAEAARKEKVSEQSIGRWKAEFIEAGKSALAAGKTGPSTREAQLEAEVDDLTRALGEVLPASAQDVPDPIERIVTAAAVAVDLLLDPTPDVVDDLGGELDDVEGIQDRAGVFELVIDGVLVPVERVQRGDLDSGSERLATLLQPRLVGLTRAAGDQVEQPGLDDQFASVVGVERQVYHPGQLLGAAPAVLDRLGAHVVPNVLVDTQPGDILEPGRVGVRGLQQRLDRGPHRAPAAAELAADAVDGRVFTTDLLDGPPGGSCGQLRSRRGDPIVLLLWTALENWAVPAFEK